MASCITWFNDFFPSATVFEFFMNIRGWLLEIYLWGEPLSPVTLGPLWYVFLIASLRCCRKVRGFSLGCKAKLLFYIDIWHYEEQVSELFWASVSSLEEWGIWSRLNYFLPLWDGWSDINATYLLYHFFFYLVMLGNWTQGFAHAGQTFFHWATSLSPNIYIYIFVL
jgi:hypothetical protein